MSVANNLILITKTLQRSIASSPAARIMMRRIMIYISAISLSLISIVGYIEYEYGTETILSAAEAFVNTISFKILASCLIIFTYAFMLSSTFSSLGKSRQFSDIDSAIKLRAKKYKQYTLKNPESNNEDIDEKLISREIPVHFSLIIKYIEKQIAKSDEKASMLLDKGVAFCFGGFAFMLLSIICWQILAWFSGDLNRINYIGIASCSLLFLFIEFLSAWFLRQYRNFANSSSYYLRLKLIFEKYQLMYLYSAECVSTPCENQDIHSNMMTTFADPICWPEIRDVDADENFARDAIKNFNFLQGKPQSTPPPTKE